jgi:hypothetical protein
MASKPVRFHHEAEQEYLSSLEWPPATGLLEKAAATVMTTSASFRECIPAPATPAPW